VWVSFNGCCVEVGTKWNQFYRITQLDASLEEETFTFHIERYLYRRLFRSRNRILKETLTLKRFNKNMIDILSECHVIIVGTNISFRSSWMLKGCTLKISLSTSSGNLEFRTAMQTGIKSCLFFSKIHHEHLCSQVANYSVTIMVFMCSGWGIFYSSTPYNVVCRQEGRTIERPLLVNG
jgi:hypothetical protein